ncbi:MAG TPA: hypothetical protein VIB39_09085 [Candidatus Angelobacter sp.]|jgi:hypothetical protein
MTPVKRFLPPLDALVVKVYHVELSECRDEREFKEGIQLVLHNLDAVMEALDCYVPEERRIRRAADRLKLKAVRLRRLCVAVPEQFDDTEEWRWVATQIIATYEQFRIDAGLLYRMAVPNASFGVLRAAL